MEQPKLEPTQECEQQANENPFLKQIQKWTDSETRLLLNKYASYCPNIGTMDGVRNKKEMWEKISTEIKGKTSKQCEDRYKTILRRKKVSVHKSLATGADTPSIESAQEFEADDAMETPSFRSIHMWSERETRLLIDKFNSYIPDIGPAKPMKNKKDMWKKISTEIEGRTAKQCEERYKTVLRRRRRAAFKNIIKFRPQKKRKKFKQEFEEFEAFEPEVLINMSKKETGTKTKSIEKTLLEIAKRKEEGRERRHKEKMEALNNIHQTLTNLLQTNHFINL
ncbi:uncharacterized protein [Eurosta solidaginis]|uniref:uncharacterized protein n=1 Tax=Eurosta solidaginis TaxID=178769 RepID=UPI0035310C35